MAGGAVGVGSVEGISELVADLAAEPDVSRIWLTPSGTIDVADCCRSTARPSSIGLIVVLEVS